ncbi:MAG: DUF2096 family protein, partial [Candidatus Bathyarchaeia archaeon]
TLEALAVEMKEMGLDVPQEVHEDLKSAKTLFSVQEVDANVDMSRAQFYLDRAETTLIAMAESYGGRDFAEKWLVKIEEARLRGLEETQKPVRVFISGVPKGQHWVRIRATEDIGQRELCSIATQRGLECKVQENGYVLVFGRAEDVKVFIREIAEKTRPKKR